MNEKDEFYDFLYGIQLHQFYEKLINDLHVSQINHLAHVSEADLLSLNMSKPESRRLIESHKSYQKHSVFKKLRRSFRISKKEVDENCKFISSPQNCISSNSKPVVNCLIKENDIVFKDLIGKGAFGYVQSAVWTVQHNKTILVAVKCLQGSKESGIAAMQDDLIQEANAMSKLTHPNLIRLFGVVMASPMCLVFELAPLGSLLRKIRNEPEKFLISTLCSFLVQIVAGMKYLEAHHFVHRDLAARNILLMTYEKVKIGDFGLARPLSNSSYYVMQPDTQIPLAWCAPECLNFGKFSHASDLWSFGVTVYEMFSLGAEPWSGLNGSEILHKIDEPNFERLKKPSYCPSTIYSIINNTCWKHIPKERGTFSTLEKELLNVLPYEVTAISARVSDMSHQLCYSQGDIITIFESNNNSFMWKGQNRRTGAVGFFPSECANLKLGTISDMLVVTSENIKSGRKIFHQEGWQLTSQCAYGFYQNNNIKNNFSDTVLITKDVLTDDSSCNESLLSMMENSLHEKESFCSSSSAGSASVDSGCCESANGSDSSASCLKDGFLHSQPIKETPPINIPFNLQKFTEKNELRLCSTQGCLNMTGISLDAMCKKEKQYCKICSNLSNERNDFFKCQFCDSGFDSFHKCLKTIQRQSSSSTDTVNNSSPDIIIQSKQSSLPPTQRSFENKLFDITFPYDVPNDIRKSESSSSSYSNILNESSVVYDFLPSIYSNVNTYDVVPKRHLSFEEIKSEILYNIPKKPGENDQNEQKILSLYDTPKPRAVSETNTPKPRSVSETDALKPRTVSETDLDADKNALPIRPPRLKAKSKRENKIRRCTIINV
ncbi:activated CDC42 kinase 1 isoform X1 [Hydra vulgaris]|uniref:non-specific protein-tyrosine kinase n=2 Tax=Hydra vulgaris TaxID=6087 RepID=A0ABM4C0X0_HYDVU